MQDKSTLTEEEVALWASEANSRLDAERIARLGEALQAAWRERDAAQREVERWRHGNTIESDFVCPNDLRATNAESRLCAEQENATAWERLLYVERPWKR